VLTGTAAVPPLIVDAQQGNVTGTTLLFSDAGSTIVVSGDPKALKGKGGRVRTETHVSPAKEERQ
jgi:lipopolysaccharide export system protein LptA